MERNVLGLRYKEISPKLWEPQNIGNKSEREIKNVQCEPEKLKTMVTITKKKNPKDY